MSPVAVARVIVNSSFGGGMWEPDRMDAELSGVELDWMETESLEDVQEAAEEWDDGLLIVAGRFNFVDKQILHASGS